MNKIKGTLLGYSATGTEGMLPIIVSESAMNCIDPGDHLTIIKDGEELFSGVVKGYVWKDKDYKKVFIDEPGFVARWDRYSPNSKNGQLHINGCWVHYIPTNIDIKLWWDIFFQSSGTYQGILISKE